MEYVIEGQFVIPFKTTVSGAFDHVDVLESCQEAPDDVFDNISRRDWGPKNIDLFHIHQVAEENADA